MTTTALTHTSPRSRAGRPWSDPRLYTQRAATPSPTFGEMLEEVLPLVGVVVVAGPAAIFVAAPLVLLALMLAAPFAVLVTFVLLGLAAATVVAVVARALVAIGSMLVRHLPRRPARSAPASDPAPQLVVVPARRVVA
jgi:hypothetical protein